MFANKIEIKESFLSVMKQVDVLSKELQVLSLIRLPRDTLKSLINELKEQKTQHRDINPDNLQKENQQVIKDILVASNYFSIQGCKERTEKTQDVLNQLQKLSNILTNLEKADKINSIRQIIEKLNEHIKYLIYLCTIWHKGYIDELSQLLSYLPAEDIEIEIDLLIIEKTIKKFLRNNNYIMTEKLTYTDFLQVEKNIIQANQI